MNGIAEPAFSVSFSPLALVVLQGSMISTGRPFFLLLFWVAVVVLVMAQGTLAVVALRRGLQRGASTGSPIAGRIVQIVWAILPALLLLGLLALSWPALRNA